MSVTIRLSRIGRKNQPAYKLVVSNTRDKRDGRYVDILGYYNPSEPSQNFSYDKEKFEKWKKRGALVTDAVNKLIEGKYVYVKYEPKKVVKKEREDAGQSQEKAVENKEEVKAEEPGDKQEKSGDTESVESEKPNKQEEKVEEKTESKKTSGKDKK